MKPNYNYGIYDFSDYAEEITGDDLFKINGGAQVANTNQGVANAKVGDTVTRNDGTTVTITQGDINWAQQQIDSSGSSGNNAQQQGPGSSGSGYNPGGATETEKKEETPAVMYDPHDPSRVIVDLDNPKAMKQAADLLADPSLGLRVTAYGSESGITKNFKNYSEISDYLNPVNTNGLSIGELLHKTFIDDGKSNIYTLGVSASGTVTSVSGAGEVGVYFNPKNNFRFVNSLLIPVLAPGMKKVTLLLSSLINNTEDFGVYSSIEAGAGIGQSGSVTLSVGTYKSLEDAKGVYTSLGISGGPKGTSFGMDMIQDFQNEIVGGTFSIGVGVGNDVEVHKRLGFTGIKSAFQDQ